MKKMKRFSRRSLALLLALVMCLGSMQITAFADEPDSGIVTDDSAGSTIADDINDDTNVDDSNDDANVDDTNVDDSNDDTNADNSNDDTNTDDSADGTNADNSNGDTNTDNANAGNSNDGTDNSNGNANVENSNNGELPPVENASTTASYATLEELEAAFMAVGTALESGDIQSGIDALDNYLAIYNRLSPEDQAANAEAKAAALAYRDTLIAAQNAQENEEPFSDPDIDTLYDTYQSYVTLKSGDGNPTGTKMKVGDTWDSKWTVLEIDKNHVKFGSTYGEHNNTFEVPAPEDIWTGVSSNYKTVAAYSSAWDGDKHVGAQAQILHTGGSATYQNVINTPSGSTDPGGGSTTPSGPYVTIIHQYYTNGSLDGSSEKEYKVVEAPTYSGVPKTIYTHEITSRKTTYNSNTYNYTSMSSNPSTVTVAKGATGNQGTFTLRYDRTVTTSKYSYQLTWNYNGGNVGGDLSRTNKVENIEESTHTFFEDAQGYGSPRPTRNGYKFTGWTYAGDAENSSFNSSNGQINMTGVAGDTVRGTLTAQWERVDTDNGAGISITKTRVSINGDANATTAEPGDEIKWNITVTNNSNVTKTVTLTEKLTGASLSENKFTLGAGKSKTVTAAYTVKGADRGKTIYNTVVGKTDKEEATGKDNGTPVDPGTKQGSFTVIKSFEGLDGDGPAVTLTYSAYRTKDGNRVGNLETGGITLTKQSNGTYKGTITPTVWDILSETEHDSYKNVVEIIEDLNTTKVTGYNHSRFRPLYVDGETMSDNTVKFVMDGATYSKDLAVKNIYNKIEPTAPELTITKEASPANVKVGETVTYTIKVENTGDAEATNVKITDMLNAEYLEWQSANFSWTAPYDGPDDDGMIHSNYAGTRIYSEQPANGVYDIPNMKPGMELDLTITAKALKAGTVKNIATIESKEIPDGPEDDADVTVEEDDIPIEIDKTVNKTEAKVGETVNYTVNITNKTGKELTVEVNDILPKGLKLGNSIGIQGAESASGSVTGTGTVVTPEDVLDIILAGITNRATSFDNLKVTIAAGKTVTLTYSATVEAGASGTLTNKATATVDGKEYEDTADVTVTKPTVPETIKVTWVDEDGTPLYGPLDIPKDDEVPKADKYQQDHEGKDPTKAEDEDYTYEFKEWSDPITDGDGNVTYKASYRRIPKVEYTVTWYDADTGNAIEGKGTETRKAAQGTKVTVKGTLTPSATEDYVVDSYTFVDGDSRNITSIDSVSAGDELKLYFRKDETRVEADYTVEWYDAATGELISSKTPNPETRNGYVDDTVSVTEDDKAVDGYVFVSGDSRNITSIKLGEDGGVLKLYFNRKAVDYTVEHEYYTNGSLTGSIQINNNGKVGDVVNAADIGKISRYGGNDYTYGSASLESITLTEGGQNTIILRYYRTTSDRRDPEPTPTPPRRNPDPTTEPDPDPSTDPAPNPTAAPSPIPSLVPGVPTVDILGTNVPLTNLPDEDVPLAGTPGKAEGLEVDIFDEEVPLSDVPKTGDISDLWYLAALLSAGMLIFLGLRRKNHR